MSCARACSCTLPNRSTRRTSARRLSPSTSGAAASRRVQSPRDRCGLPASSGAAPSARWAATGANTSRPWKVAETGSRRNGVALTSTAKSTPPAACAAGHSRPLSGPTSTVPLRDRSATPRRCAADARVDDRQHDPAGKERQRVLQHECGMPDVGRRQIVRDVDHGRAGGDALDHAMTDAHPLVAVPVVGQEGDRQQGVPYAAGAAAGASRSSASTSPATSWRSASMWTSRPRSRAVWLVTGPIDTTRARSGKCSTPPIASSRKRTVDELVKVT